MTTATSLLLLCGEQNTVIDCFVERVYEAHRSHGYQWLSRRWQSHKRVTLLVWVINIGWLLPMAWLCTHYPERAVLVVGIALMPLVALALLAGAGRAESNEH